jgi:long-chain acyl-CoA synthetase
MTATSPALEPGLAAVRTLPELLSWRVARTPEAEAYRVHDAARSAWQGVCWREFGERVARFAAALQRMRLEPGARVAILLPNGLDAVGLDQAVLRAGCVPVPLYVIDNPGNAAYILADSQAALLVADTRAQWDGIVATGAVPATLRQVVIREDFGPAEQGSRPEIVTLASWLADAVPSPVPGAGAREVSEEDLAAIVYTSGTTGKPKGVMLTHRNVLANIKALMQHLEARADDVYLSFLPLSHTFERTCGYYLPIACGASVAFARSVQLLAEDMVAVRPTILVSVPRIYERVHAKVHEKLEASPAKLRLFQWAQAVGWRRFCRAQKLAVPAGGSALEDALAWPLLERLVARPLLERFGGRVRVAVSGGAALSHPIGRAFLGLGLPVVQGYGMTESAPVIAANTPEDNDPDTVGRPLPGVEVRIGDNQELLVRGPNVMRGYWQREEDSAKALAGGWLHTGDQAGIDANGRVHILGRVKEIIVTSTGEKIAPADLEMAIVADPLFEQAYCFGESRPFIACIAVLGREPWQRLAAGLGLDPERAESLRAPTALAAALERIRELTREFPAYAQPKVVGLTLEAWTVEGGLITPTLKLKRASLVRRYADDMERLYSRA